MSPERKREDRALYVISVAAELAGVHPQTLRIYERKGLVEPQRTIGRSRRYSDRDIRRLQRIQELTNGGVSLAGVKRIIALEEELDDARGEIERLEAELENQRTQADQAVAEVHRQYRRDLIPFSKAVIRFGPGR
ncbi:MAG: MerR family transcriptional regulator [Actinomycetota bacterium]|nr:MerR family transcriptional regulator [Actinomycetota bacterium]